MAVVRATPLTPPHASEAPWPRAHRRTDRLEGRAGGLQRPGGAMMMMMMMRRRMVVVVMMTMMMVTAWQAGECDHAGGVPGVGGQVPLPTGQRTLAGGMVAMTSSSC
jgi:hypothetical protein